MEENNNENLNVNSVDKDSKKEKFIPSYANKNNKDGSKTKKENNKNKIFKSKITVIILAVIICLVIAISLFVILKETNIEYGEYDSLMQKYGFEDIYSNDSVAPNEKVSKSEAIKMIVAATLNINDISKGFYLSDKSDVTYDNELWVRYAKSVEMISENEITKENQNNDISYIECVRYIAKAKQKILGRELDKDTIPSFKDYEGYNSEQQIALSDLVYNNIVEDSKSRLNGNKKLTKSKLNEMIVKYVVKYNLITLNEDKINIREEKKPSNEKDYPYTLIGIDKSIYEIPFKKINDDAKTPIEVFADLKYDYSKINESIINYLNVILNVDSSNFDEDEFIKQALKTSYQGTNTDKLKEYCSYIKSNNIKISGNAKVILPIIYFDGENYRVRLKIDYNVERADSLSNLIYGDSFSDGNVIYELGKKEIYIDLPFSKITTGKVYYYRVNTSNSLLKCEVK